MKTVSIHEAKKHLSALIHEIEREGETVVLSRYGRPVATLSAVKAAQPRTKTHPNLARVQIHGDLTKPTEEEWENAG
jgi:antitoxin (DNA-binding transcriptional repressor) of toxin-antitoxin stability system